MGAIIYDTNTIDMLTRDCLQTLDVIDRQETTECEKLRVASDTLHYINSILHERGIKL